MLIINTNQKLYIKRWGIIRSIYAYVMGGAKRRLGFVCCAILTRPAGSGTLPSVSPADAASGTGREYRLLSREELVAFSADPDLDLNVATINKSFARGDTCAGAIENGELLGYIWRAFEPIPHYRNLWVEVGPNARYTYKAFTREGYRGQRIVANIAAVTENSYRGRTHNITFIETHNYPSLHSAIHTGNIKIGYAGYCIIKGRNFTFRSPGAKRFRFRFYTRM